MSGRGLAIESGRIGLGAGITGGSMMIGTGADVSTEAGRGAGVVIDGVAGAAYGVVICGADAGLLDGVRSTGGLRRVAGGGV